MPVRPSNTKTPSTRAFGKNEDGSIAIIFALCTMVVFTTTGLAIDIGRVMHAERTISNAIDAAALAAAKGMKMSRLDDAEVEAVAQRYFDINMTGHGGSYANIQSFNVQINRANNSVGIEVTSEVPTIFGQLAGISSISVPRGSVAIFDTKDIEIGLQLDVTGSMCQPCDKIEALKDAVAGRDGLLDIMMPDAGTTNQVRIGLAPFAAGVNAGSYVSAVTNGRTPADGCVYERRNAADQATERPPTGPAALKTRSDVRGANPCPTNAKVIALTDSKTTLRTEIDGWSRPTGSTAGHLGAAWAWGLVSPDWKDVWGGTAPAAYGDGRTEKYVILMTDGIYNTVGGTSNGDHGSTAAQSQRFAQDTCTAMKAKGIVVYTIGFQAPNDAKADLRRCASAPTKFYDASNAGTLRDAFRAIATEINSLRLSS